MRSSMGASVSEASRVSIFCFARSSEFWVAGPLRSALPPTKTENTVAEALITTAKADVLLAISAYPDRVESIAKSQSAPSIATAS